MSSTEQEIAETFLFAEPVVCAEEGEMEIDEETTERIMSLDPLFVPNFDAPVERSEVCVFGEL